MPGSRAGACLHAAIPAGLPAARQEAAWGLIRFMASPAAQLRMAIAGNGPVRAATLADASFNTEAPYAAASKVALEHATDLLPVFEGSVEVNDIFTQAAVAAIIGQTAPEAAMAEAQQGIPVGLLNSAVVTAGAILLVLLAALPAAYAYSRFRGSSARGSALLVLGLKMLPPFIVTVPLFPLFQFLHLDDSRLGLILVYAAFEVSIEVFLLKTFIDQVPAELEEAALLDGCGRLQAFLHVVLPLIWPGVLAVVIFVALFSWNDYMFGLVLTTTRTETGPVVLADMFGSIGEGTASWGQVFAAATLQMLPMLALVWATQRRMLGSLLAGAVKG